MKKLTLRYFLAFAVLTLAALVLACHSRAEAAETVFSRDYTYRASDADSKLSSRAVALEQVKRILLEELGTYLKSETIIRDSELSKDEVTVLTAGVVSTEIVDERWDGATYYIKVEIAADPVRIAESIRELVKEKEDLEDLKESRAQTDSALKEVERLRGEIEAARASLAQADGSKAPAGDNSTLELERKYKESTERLAAADRWEKGRRLFKKQKYEKAIEHLTRAIELDPKMVQGYGLRGAAYNRTGRFKEAVEDLSKAIKMKPESGKLYFRRHYAYKKLGRNGKSRADLRRSADLGFWKAKRKLNKK